MIVVLLEDIKCTSDSLRLLYKSYLKPALFKTCLRNDKSKFCMLCNSVLSKNAVSANIKHTIDTSIKYQILGQFTTVVKGCMYICLLW